MNRNLGKNKKIILFALVFVFIFTLVGNNFIFAAGDSPAPAANKKVEAKTGGQSEGSSGWFSIGNISARAIATIAEVLAYILGFIAGIFFWLGGVLITLGLNINGRVLDSIFVKNGWEIVRNITNLGFVIAIIIIAFATIFRRESYAMKQTLGKLIVAALLVNFSLVIAGSIINLSQNLSYYLISKIVSNPVEFSTKVAGMFEAQKLMAVAEEGQKANAGYYKNKYFTVDNLSSIITAVASLIFVA
ncbi:hypothetical protein HY227_00255, partial [Candidatus Wolfebacteria bacterium]|nr:hypothetical protein [Candidatus Wolfebacteria bacterium]